jgi:hypothetical protein
VLGKAELAMSCNGATFPTHDTLDTVSVHVGADASRSAAGLHMPYNSLRAFDPVTGNDPRQRALSFVNSNRHRHNVLKWCRCYPRRFDARFGLIEPLLDAICGIRRAFQRGAL